LSDHAAGPLAKIDLFSQVEGAPLDNTTEERALRLAIRQRKNSLFYAAEYSAYIASPLTGPIATCLHAGVNALEALVALQEHRTAVLHVPAARLPWNDPTNLAPPSPSFFQSSVISAFSASSLSACPV